MEGLKESESKDEDKVNRWKQLRGLKPMEDERKLQIHIIALAEKSELFCVYKTLLFRLWINACFEFDGLC